MKKTEMKIMGKIGMEIGKLAVFWMAIVPWMSDLMEYDWDWNENLVSVVIVTAATFAGYFCVVNVKAKIEELKAMKEERKNSKKRGNAAKAAPVLFFFLLDILVNWVMREGLCDARRGDLRGV